MSWNKFKKLSSFTIVDKIRIFDKFYALCVEEKKECDFNPDEHDSNYFLDDVFKLLE